MLHAPPHPPSVAQQPLEGQGILIIEERTLRVFENMVLRGIFGRKVGEVTGEWRKLHNEELNDLYCSPNIVRVIKSRRMRWAGQVAFRRDRRGVLKVLVGKETTWKTHA